ncbi:hypothetical protein U1Q18_047258 [Sarracenia purpurea var. burkii]
MSLKWSLILAIKFCFLWVQIYADSTSEKLSVIVNSGEDTFEEVKVEILSKEVDRLGSGYQKVSRDLEEMTMLTGMEFKKMLLNEYPIDHSDKTNAKNEFLFKGNKAETADFTTQKEINGRLVSFSNSKQ